MMITTGFTTSLNYQIRKYIICMDKKNILLTFHSKPPTAIPLAAAVPARPTKWPLPMLLAKRDVPTCVRKINMCNLQIMI